MATMDNSDVVVPHVDCKLSKDDLMNTGLVKIVETLRPDWKLDELKIEDRSSGYMNSNYAVNQPSGKDGIFVRIVNNAFQGQLQRATNNMKYLKKRKLGAQLLLTFENGLVMEFLEGEMIGWDTLEKVRDPQVWLSVAREMARYHATTDWNDIKKYSVLSMDDLKPIHNKILKEAYYSGKVSEERKKGLPTPEEMQDLHAMLLKDLKEQGAEKRFTHIDANPTNILIQQGKEVVFVDYDDCVVEFTCVEISRFFATLCGVLEGDFSKLPTPEEEDSFIREYLEYRRVLEPERGPVNEKLVDYWKFLLRRSALLSWVGGSAATMFLSHVSDKPVDETLGQKFWKRYVDTHEAVLRETFHWE